MICWIILFLWMTAKVIIVIIITCHMHDHWFIDLIKLSVTGVFINLCCLMNWICFYKAEWGNVGGDERYDNCPCLLDD